MSRAALPARDSARSRTLPRRLAWVGLAKPAAAGVADQVQWFGDSDDFLLAPDAFGFDFYVVQLAQQGVPGLDLVATGWNGFFAPAGMPAQKVSRYAGLIHEIMREPDTQRRFEEQKMTPMVTTQAQTQAMLKAYRAQWAPVVQKSGYTP